MIRKMKLPGGEGKTAVVIGTKTDDVHAQPRGVQASRQDLRNTKPYVPRAGSSSAPEADRPVATTKTNPRSCLVIKKILDAEKKKKKKKKNEAKDRVVREEEEKWEHPDGTVPGLLEN
ncbi:hypothetical protein E2I00_006856 [Balaenoptera physalus]|uniref:Uncharacterized protein n=1 Tax=Balaenoptera physalus TaxID=9770 RepID=A0A643ATQ3_BALPH|nr:hypothetical protein E2I00_006856 [Balaenoptera physalus]